MGKQAGWSQQDELIPAPNCDSVISYEKVGHMRKWVLRISYVLLTLLVLALLAGFTCEQVGTDLVRASSGESTCAPSDSDLQSPRGSSH